jgi:hypothetical protein
MISTRASAVALSCGPRGPVGSTAVHRLTCGSYRHALMTASLGLSRTMRRGTPPMAARARVCAPTQSPRSWVQVASTLDGGQAQIHGEELDACGLRRASGEHDVAFGCETAASSSVGA